MNDIYVLLGDYKKQVDTEFEQLRAKMIVMCLDYEKEIEMLKEQIVLLQGHK